jgi:hypothetical protein
VPPAIELRKEEAKFSFNSHSAAESGIGKIQTLSDFGLCMLVSMKVNLLYAQMFYKLN